MLEEQERNAAEEKLINEEYKIWKKNSPFLYDTVITHALEWPTLTAQWFPDVERPEGKDYTVHRLLLGTHTSDSDTNYVQIASVHLPRDDITTDSEETGGHTGGPAGTKITVTQQIPHEGEVNRARYMPQKPDVLATKTVAGDVLVFDRTKFPLKPPRTTNGEPARCNPTLRLRGHSKEGYGLNWSSVLAGQLISSAEDALICHWDLQKMPTAGVTIDPLRIYKGHATCVGDVSWHRFDASLFASVGDDRQLLVWDTRVSSTTSASLTVPDAHDAEINAVDFNPAIEFLVATAGNDAAVKLWDTRNLRRSVATLEGHKADIVSVTWNPHDPAVLATASVDRRVHVWDTARIGEEQSPEDAEDGPPELLFVHGGHTGPVQDVAWSPVWDWGMVSVDQQNVVQVWQMAAPLRAGADAMEDVPEAMLE
ncbi:histone-binding protein RBBP4-like protein [Blastocladiella britannica]|nr:histone-binding protein RBBP4-like protein [Blastocladiella britannica]